MRIVVGAVFAALTLAIGATMVVPASRAPAQPAPQCTAGESTTAFGEWFDPHVSLDTQARTAARIVPQLTAPAAGVRLQIGASSPPGQTWSLILRDDRLRILAILTVQDGAAGGAPTQWTGRLDAAQLSAELVGGGPGLSVAFSSGMALPKNSEGVNVFSIRGDKPTWTDPYARDEIKYRRAAEAVGMLVTGAKITDGQGVSRKGTWCCSGAMLTPTIYITNWHCGGTSGIPETAYWNQQVCDNAVLDLGWQEGSNARRQYACEEVLRQDKRLDYVLLRVKPIIGPGSATGRAPPVRISRELPASDDIFMVHHAQCKPKLVSFENCRIDKRSYRSWMDPAGTATGPEIAHTCDSEPGASGAPMFDSGGRMIALHHLGFQGGGPQCTSDRLNKAVTIAAIYADIAQAKPGVFAELEAQP